MKLLTKSDRLLKDRGFRQIGSMTREHGVISPADIGGDVEIKYTIHTMNDIIFYVRAKKQVYQNLASFGKEHVDDAIEDNAKLMIYFADRNKHYVLEPRTVRMEGNEVVNECKMSRKEKWLEVSLDKAVPLENYPDEEPEKPDQGGLSDFI